MKTSRDHTPIAAGTKFGMLTVVQKINESGRAAYLCRCDCGRDSRPLGCNLRGGKSKSCGCVAAKLVRQRRTTHGQSSTRTYRIWVGMIKRCTVPTRDGYVDYGGRGIRVAERWLHSFENFLVDLGECPAGLSLDRFPDNEGNYEPGNCRWATRHEQQTQQCRNTRANHLLTINGQTKCLTEWCEIHRVAVTTAWNRLKRGLSPERAFGL